MAFEQRDMNGSLFRNKKTKDSHPDYRGDCMVRGEKLEMAAWLKEDKNGRKFFSIKFSEPRPRPGADSDDSSVPF